MPQKCLFITADGLTAIRELPDDMELRLGMIVSLPIMRTPSLSISPEPIDLIGQLQRNYEVVEMGYNLHKLRERI